MVIDLAAMYENNLSAAISKHKRSSVAQVVTVAERVTVAEVKALVRQLSSGAVPEAKVETVAPEAPTVEGNDPATLPELESLTAEESAELDILAAA